MSRYGLTLATCLVWSATGTAQPGTTSPEHVPVQGPSPEGEAKPPVLLPPELVTFVEATYPAAAFEQGLQAKVSLRLTVGVDGIVQEASVITPVGNGFDEAALEAGKQLIFKPATSDGTPIVAIMAYSYHFDITLVEPPPEPEGPPPPAVLQGLVLSLDDDTPVAGAKLKLTSADGVKVTEGESDSKGRFRWEVEAGQYTITMDAPDFETLTQGEVLEADELYDVTYRMSEVMDPDLFVAVARVRAPPREVTRRSIGKQQLTRMAGTRGDALRTVELMPGVARPPLGAGALIVRGSAPQDTIAMFEGVPVPLLYHFGGLTSFINSRLLESVEFYPGNFSARYGRRRGGVVDVQARDPAKDRYHGVADINLIDTSLLVEAPLTDDWEFAAAGRRSYIDVLLEGALEDQDVSIIAAPVYYDYQAITTYRPTDKDRLRLMVYGSSDELALLFKETDDVLIGGDFDLTSEFHRVHGSWRRELSSKVDQDINFAVGRIDVGIGLGESFDFRLEGTEIYGRSEWQARISSKVRLITGIDLVAVPGSFTYTGSPPTQSEGMPDNMGASATTLSNRDSISAGSDFAVVQPAVFVESDLNLDPWRLVLGTRVDYYEGIDAFSFDPRVVAHYALTDQLGIKAGVGMFSQPPQFQEEDEQLGNPNLDPQHTLHLGGGVDYEPVDFVSIGVDGFYKHLYDVVVGTEFGEAPRFTNDGIGRIYGLELLAKVDPQGRFFGYLSYTLSRSERNDRGKGWRLFDFDQPHIMTVSAVYRLGSGWETGLTFRLVSGNPTTPITGSFYNEDTGQFSPIYGEINSLRQPMFHRLDLRLEKLWRFKAWKLAFYIDVQNVYNAENPEGRIYDYRYEQYDSIRGLPIIPNLGLRGEM